MGVDGTGGILSSSPLSQMQAIGFRGQARLEGHGSGCLPAPGLQLHMVHSLSAIYHPGRAAAFVRWLIGAESPDEDKGMEILSKLQDTH